MHGRFIFVRKDFEIFQAVFFRGDRSEKDEEDETGPIRGKKKKKNRKKRRRRKETQRRTEKKKKK